MRRLIVLLTFAFAAVGQPSVSNVRTDYVPAPNGAAPHSYMRFRWNVSSQACFHRVQFGQTLSYGDILLNTDCQTTDLGFPISGLAPNTKYFYLVQSSFDGSNWSSNCSTCSGSFTTATLPSPHPAPPQISNLWAPTFPNTAGYHTVTVANDCHDLNADINAAVALQPTNGTVITIPNEATATAACGPVSFPDDHQILKVPQDAGHVDTTTGVFTATTIPSGWTITNGQQVFFVGSCVPGSQTQGNDSNSFNGGTESCNTQGPLTPGALYYIVGASGSTFKLSATNGGSPIIPGDTGNAGAGPMMFEQWPLMNSNWIIIQTSTPDSQFCPQGVRCMGSIWQSKMAHIQAQGGCFNCNGGNTGFFTHHVWFRGIDLDATDTTALAATTVDPQATNHIFYVPASWANSFIVIDRSYIHCPPFPNRCSDIIRDYSGRNMAIINSDLENFNYWRPSSIPVKLNNAAQGLSGTLSGSTVTIVPGSIRAPIATCTSTSNITFIITGGSASGAAYAFASSASTTPPPLLGPCIPTLVMPLGMTATCTGSMTDSNSVLHPCAVTNSATPGWPGGGNLGVDCFQLGVLFLSAGVPAAFSTFDNSNSGNYNQSAWLTEGTQGLNWGGGPGPFTFNGNYLEGTGLNFHIDDSTIVDPISIWVKQNTFLWDQKHKIGSPTSDNYEYVNRNGPEMKHGRQMKFDGNILTGSWNSVSLTGSAVLFHIASNQETTGTAGGLSQPGYTTQDIDITNNTFWNHNACIEVGGGQMNLTPFPAMARVRIQNNVCNTNGWTQTDGNTGAAALGGGSGEGILTDGAIEDLIVDHNTFYDNRGTAPVMWHSQVNWDEGCQITNNFLWFNEANTGFSAEQNPGTFLTPSIGGSGGALFNTLCTSDPNTPGGIMTNNVAVPFFSSSGPGAPTGLVSPQSICSNFGGGTLSGNHCPGGQISTVLNGASAAANLASIGYTSTAIAAPNLMLTHNSPFISGAHFSSDGADVGADMNALMAAQGAVGTPRVAPIGATTATISWWAYDKTVACSMDYATSPNDASTQTGGGRVTPSLRANSQTVVLTGLTPGTGYNYRVLCPVNQPTGGFVTQ
jgi:hypothetical protein